MSVTISIFESLTARNPDIQHEEPDSYTLTRNDSFMWPKELREWKEFNFQTLESMYGGDLMTVARQRNSTLLNYPDLTPDVDCIVYCEPTTQHILTKWSHTIVQAALTAVQEKFNACNWSPHAGGRRRELDQRSTPVCDNSSPAETSPSQPASSTIFKKLRIRRKPDSGGILTCRTHGALCPSSSIERLPKDYKAAKKWKSSDVTTLLIDDKGRWKEGTSKDMSAMPIRQVYTYCVGYRCRYGCILTTEEAFIFRIKPREDDLGKNLVVIVVLKMFSHNS